jgi:NADPH:quinone reductase-like Zn-dependent oxidoreductase
VKMQAVVYERYGPPEVLRPAEVEKPFPRPDDVLIRVYATSVSAGDCRMRRADPALVRLISGLFRPKKVPILGFELAGVVEETGRNVTRFKPGDEVFAMAGFGFGCYAEYRCLPERPDKPKTGFVGRKPANLSFEEAAVIPCGAVTALAAMRDLGVDRRGGTLLVYGASGSVGSYAVQLARHFGAKVTGVCSTGNIDMVRSLGVDEVIDYTTTDFSRLGRTWDAVFDAVAKADKAACKRVLASGGGYLNVHHTSDDITSDDMDFLRELAEAGELRSVIDRRYRLDEIVEAHRYVERGHKKGNVVVTVRPSGE